MEPGRSAETGDDHGAAADLVEASPQGVAAAGFSEDDKTRRTEITSVRDRQSETQGLRTHKERRTGHTTAADQIDLPLGRGPDPAPSCELEQRLTWTYTVRGGPVGGPAIARAAGATRGRNHSVSDYGSEGWGFESLLARSVLRQTTMPLTSGGAGGGLARSRMHISFTALRGTVFGVLR